MAPETAHGLEFFNEPVDGILNLSTLRDWGWWNMLGNSSFHFPLSSLIPLIVLAPPAARSTADDDADIR
jgi:hypothetical protein